MQPDLNFVYVNFLGTLLKFKIFNYKDTPDFNTINGIFMNGEQFKGFNGNIYAWLTGKEDGTKAWEYKVWLYNKPSMYVSGFTMEGLIEGMFSFCKDPLIVYFMKDNDYSTVQTARIRTDKKDKFKFENGTYESIKIVRKLPFFKRHYKATFKDAMIIG